LQHEPQHQRCNKDCDANQEGVHSFSNSVTGNGNSTLLAVVPF
jgi:hypothetical protein